MKQFLLLFFAFFIMNNVAIGQDAYGILEGKLIDSETKEGLIAASITLYKIGGKMPIVGNSTDINGNFSIDSIPVGIYDVELSYVGYKGDLVKHIEIKENVKFSLVRSLGVSTEIRDCSPIVTYAISLIQLDYFGTGRIYKARDIKNMPTK